MKVQLPINVYTQINTNSTEFLIQNTNSSNSVKIIASATQPAFDDTEDFILQPYSGIGNSHIESLIWGKPISKTPISVGLVEG